jgi:hypothetical protein
VVAAQEPHDLGVFEEAFDIGEADSEVEHVFAVRPLRSFEVAFERAHLFLHPRDVLRFPL